MYTAQLTEREQIRKTRRERALRRQKERRRFLFLFAVTLVLMFTVGVGFGTLLTRAEEPVQSGSYKYYSSIELESGDTLWDLAGEYMDEDHYISRADYINEVMTINHMSDDRLVSGQKLIVPYYSEELR
ncbi:MAG: LysM peptidoglycan-binding domain-containing protein [Eubacteriales bacterium]|nr:LysM peptidoglycan-binding domain-containing protein [Eubacteriales bacterium]